MSKGVWRTQVKADDYYEQKEKTCQWIAERLLPVADIIREGTYDVNTSDSEA